MSHGAKFPQNPRFDVRNCFHDLENVSVKGTIDEDMFINAPSDHPMRKIYDEKIKVVPPDLVLNKIGKKGSIPYIISGEYLAFSSARSYKKLKQFPCEITALQSASEIT